MMIEVSALTKHYGAFRAVENVSFSVDRGEVVGFLGPNGAGKSTTLRILAGFLGATSGRVKIGGIDIQDDPLGARRLIGYMPETSPLYPEMRVGEYLHFRAELKKVPRGERKAAVLSAMEQAKVDDFASVLIGHLSKGYRQRVGLADALVARAPLLILDEPTAGLDPNQIREVRNLVRDLGKTRTVLVSTHILPEVEALCSRAVVIARGRLVANGTIAELRRLRTPTGFVISARGPAEKIEAILRKVKGIQTAIRTRDVPAQERGDPDVHTFVASAREKGTGVATLAEEAVRALVHAGLGVREVVVQKPTLEQVFGELTGNPDPEVPGAGPPDVEQATSPDEAPADAAGAKDEET